MPLAHHLEARENADVAKPGDLAEQLDHLARAFLMFGDFRRILRIDQHEVGARRLDARDAVLHQLRGLVRIEISQHRVGADLPDHEIGLHVDHFALQPFHHFGRVLAAATAIDDRDVGARILPVKLRCQAIGIGELG